MEQYILDKDIKAFYITASSFPEGVQEAHQKLHSLVPYTSERKYFGISYPNRQGTIIYKAAMNELKDGELSGFGLEEFIIKKGAYISIIIKDFMKDIPAIGKAFDKLISDPRIDPQGACIEWYFNEKDVQCMVRLKSE